MFGQQLHELLTRLDAEALQANRWPLEVRAPVDPI
jgi:hypothetical protein